MTLFGVNYIQTTTIYIFSKFCDSREPRLIHFPKLFFLKVFFFLITVGETAYREQQLSHPFESIFYVYKNQTPYFPVAKTKERFRCQRLGSECRCSPTLVSSPLSLKISIPGLYFENLEVQGSYQGSPSSGCTLFLNVVQVFPGKIWNPA